MSDFNVPDDWGSYYDNCPRCNARTHASEQYSCPCDEDYEELEAVIERHGEEIAQALAERNWKEALKRAEALEACLEDAINHEQQRGLY